MSARPPFEDYDEPVLDLPGLRPLGAEEEQRRGDEARVVLQSRVFKEAIQGMRDAIHDAFEQAPIRDLEGLQGLKYQLAAVNGLEASLQDIAATGKMATIALKEHANGKEN